jgi:tRNA(His) guanylyltransferase
MKELPSPPLSSEQKDHGENSAADTTQNTTKPSDAVPRQEPTTSSPPPKSQAEKVQQAITKSTRATSSSNSKVAKSKVAEPGGWAAATKNDEDTGMPREMSRTQREKERKKRTKARIVIEHVDVIRDEFWEKRPWILSGRAGH